MRFEPGAPVSNGAIPLSVPDLRGNEWNYVKECLDTNWVSSAGPFVDRFERMVAQYIGTEWAVATVNGTAALHIALLVAGVRPDDEVLVSTLTFVAPANAIRYVGAWPVAIDAEARYWQMDPERVASFVEDGCQWVRGELRDKITKRCVRAILPVHILGHSVDMDPLLEVARKYSLVVIEDSTEGLGAEYKGRRVGSLGDIACMSFNGNKIITSGGGGMIVTDNKTWAERARYLSTQAKDDEIEYIHSEIGYNYRLSNLQAAVGCAQQERLSAHVAAKRRIAQAYNEKLRDVPGIEAMQEAPWAFSSFWMYTVLVNPAQYGMDRRVLLPKLAEKGIQTRPLWQPMHRSTVFREERAVVHGAADHIYEKALSLPCSVGLTEEQQSKVVAGIRLFSAGGRD